MPKKIVKIKVKREVEGGTTHYVYPPEYDAKKIQVLCYESVGDVDTVVARDSIDSKNSYEYLIGVVSDKDFVQFSKSKDVEEVDYATACVHGRKWRPQVEKILDNNKVLSILSKAARGEVLTQADKDVLDPNKPDRGVNKSKLFDDLLSEHL